MNFDQEFAKAIAYRENNDCKNAEDILKKLLKSKSKRIKLDAIYNELGLISIMKNDPEHAIEYFKEAMKIDPHNDELKNSLASAYIMGGHCKEAETCLLQVIERNPDYLVAYRNLSVLYKVKKDYSQAIEWLQKILVINSKETFALTALGEIYSALGNLSKAYEYYNEAINVKESSQTYFLLGVLCSDQCKYKQAIDYFQKAIKLEPENPSNYNSLAGCYKNLRMTAEARAAYGRALDCQDPNPEIFSNYLFFINADPSFSDEMLFQEHKRYGDIFRKYKVKLKRKAKQGSKQKIRIGFISGDFRTHSVAYFLLALLTHYDRSQFSIYCYSDTEKVDVVTEQLKKLVDGWHETRSLDHIALAELIVEDQIDILVDLAGHTAYNRLLVFINKPAPIQVSWIGYPYTTGIDTMDYRITDVYVDPPGMTERFNTEKLVRLPESFLCYVPNECMPEVSELPATSNGYIVFGCLNNFGKFTDDLLCSWGEILRKVPQAKLLLKSSVGAEDAAEIFEEQFRRCGIDLKRVIQEPFKTTIASHLETYHNIDIALDCFIYHGTTTTCEAMYMGVPVVTLAGSRHASRVGVSLLSNVGLAEFVAYSPEEYVEIAVGLANRIEYLKEIRRSLREKMRNSALMQPQRFTHQLENLFKTMMREKKLMPKDIIMKSSYNEEVCAALMKIVALLEKEGVQIESQLKQSDVGEAIVLCCRFMESFPRVQDFVRKNFSNEENLNKLLCEQLQKGMTLLLDACERKNIMEIQDIFSNILLKIFNTAHSLVKKHYLNSLANGKKYNQEHVIASSNETSEEAGRLVEEMNKFPFWYHKIELPGGVVTPGWAPLNRDSYQIPADMTGMRVLDVGSWDGFWAFEALKRGAKEVVAIDDFSDFLGSLEESDRKAWETFDFCKKALGYSDEQCKRMEISVYDITEEILGRFDIVFCFGVLYHLRHPLLALDKLSALCDKEMYVETAILDDFSPYQGGLGHGYPGPQYVAEFYSEDQYGQNHTNWWVPTLHCLAQLLIAAGLHSVDVWKLTDNPTHLSQCRGFARGRKEAKQ